MSYKLPSTHIYQLLESSGGAANITPDLSTVIIGTLMNLVDIDIDKAKARSSDFSVWPRTVVNPDPEPEPEPEESIFTINPVAYVDFGASGNGFTVTGTSSDDIGTNISLTLVGRDDTGTEVDRYDLTSIGSISRNSTTKLWTLVVDQSSLESLDTFGGYPSNYVFGIEGIGYKPSGSDLTETATVTRLLAPMTTIASPVLDPTIPGSLSVNQPIAMYSYENVILEEES